VCVCVCVWERERERERESKRESSRCYSLDWGSIHSALLKVTQATHSLLKFIQSDVSWKTNVCHYSGPLQQLFFTTPITHHPSRLIHWWISLNAFHCADTTGDMAFLSSEILSLRLCQSAERVWNTLLFKWTHKKELQANRSDKQAGQEMSPWTSLFSGTSLSWMHGGQPTADPCLYQMVSLPELTASLVSVLISGLPMYYINQNAELMLPYPVRG